jgi:hypothetical protein
VGLSGAVRLRLYVRLHSVATRDLKGWLTVNVCERNVHHWPCTLSKYMCFFFINKYVLLRTPVQSKCLLMKTNHTVLSHVGGIHSELGVEALTKLVHMSSVGCVGSITVIVGQCGTW